MRKALAAAAVLALLPGCALLSQLLQGAFQKPSLSYVSWAPRDLGLNGVTIDLHYRLDNPNDVGFRVARLAYQLDVEGRRVAAGDLPDGLEVPAAGSAPLTFSVRLRFGDIPAFVETLAHKDVVAWKLSGTVGFDSPIGPIDLPWDHADTAPVPRLPRFQLASARVSSLSFAAISLAVKLKITNPNPFPLPAAGLDYALSLAGANVVSGQAAQVGTIGPGQTGEVDLPVSLSLLGAGSAVANAVRAGRLDVSLHGAAGFGGLKLPLELSGELPVLR